MRPKGPWITDDAFGLPILWGIFAIGHIAWGMTSQSGNFVSDFSSALFWTILLILWVTQLAAVLHVGSMVSCHNFLSFLLCFNKRTRPGISYLRSKIVDFLVDSLYVKAKDVAKSHVVLSASSEERIWIFGEDMSSEVKHPVCQFFNWI